MEDTMFIWDRLKKEAHPIVIYGSGNGAEKLIYLCKQFEISPVALCVSDSHWRSGSFQDYPMLRRIQAAEMYPDAIFLLAFGTEREEDIQDLLDFARDHTLIVPDIPLVGGHILTPSELESRSEEIAGVRALFADAQSQQLFDHLLSYKSSGSLGDLMACTTPRSALFSLLQLCRNECYLDLGAYRGDTIDEFLSFTEGDFKAITALEPDSHNFRFLTAAYGSRADISLLPLASWHEKSTLEFAGKGGRNCCIKPDLPGRYTHLHTVDAIDIDSLALEISYVKMDVEGAERETLLGMADTLRRYKPKMLVSAYHKPDDFITLPLLVHQLLPEKRLYLRRTPCIPAWEIQLAAV